MENFTPPIPEIPDKLYFKIGEVTSVTDLAAYVLRFWEAEFKIISPKRTEAGQRLYRRSDIEAIFTIKHLLYDKKFTIQGAKKFLRDTKKQKVKPAPKTSLEEIRDELQVIRNMLD